MKLHPDQFSSQSISGYGTGWLAVNGERFAHSIVVGSRGERYDWRCTSFDALGASHFDRLAETTPELVIFGSGTRLRFPPPVWLRTLIERRIGVETMDTAAACRTYNILAGEGRNVIAALLLETAA